MWYLTYTVNCQRDIYEQPTELLTCLIFINNTWYSPTVTWSGTFGVSEIITVIFRVELGYELTIFQYHNPDPTQRHRVSGSETPRIDTDHLVPWFPVGSSLEVWIVFQVGPVMKNILSVSPFWNHTSYPIFDPFGLVSSSDLLKGLDTLALTSSGDIKTHSTTSSSIWMNQIRVLLEVRKRTSVLDRRQRETGWPFLDYGLWLLPSSRTTSHKWRLIQKELWLISHLNHLPFPSGVLLVVSLIRCQVISLLFSVTTVFPPSLSLSTFS